jgi:glycosyltransferase involved in cell wall biosynthesis
MDKVLCAKVESSEMSKIAISVIENIGRTTGTTIRARSIAKLLRSEYEILIITRAESMDSKLLRSLNLKQKDLILVKPEGTRFWNLKLVPAVLRNRFNCVYCVADVWGFITYYLLSKLLKYKIIFEAHALAHKEREQVSKVKAIIYLLLETFVGKKANVVIALSGIVYSFYRKLNENVFFIPVFIDTRVFTLKKSRKEGSEKIVGIVGPFDTIQNKYQLNFLCRNLNRFDEKIRFKIIGKCNKTVFHDRLEYTGYMTQSEYLHTLQQLDALLVPVNFATYGPKNKILEAMACGIPVFTTPKGAVGLDFVKSYADIFICEENQIVDEINRLIFDEGYMINVGLNARHIIEKYYSEAIYRDKVLSLIRRIS